MKHASSSSDPSSSEAPLVGTSMQEATQSQAQHDRARTRPWEAFYHALQRVRAVELVEEDHALAIPTFDEGVIHLAWQVEGVEYTAAISAAGNAEVRLADDGAITLADADGETVVVKPLANVHLLGYRPSAAVLDVVVEQDLVVGMIAITREDLARLEIVAVERLGDVTKDMLTEGDVTLKQADHLRSWLSVDSYPYGVLVHVRNDGGEDDPGYHQALRKFSPQFQGIMQMARVLGVRRLRIDRDEDVPGGFIEQEW